MDFEEIWFLSSYSTFPDHFLPDVKARVCVCKIKYKLVKHVFTLKASEKDAIYI